MRHRLLVGTLGFLKAGCKLQGGGRRRKTRKSTLRRKGFKGGIGNFGNASSSEEEMEFENGDKVPVTPTNSPPPELEYPWDKEDEDEKTKNLLQGYKKVIEDLSKQVNGK